MLPPGFLCTSPLAQLGELERSEGKHYSATTKATKLNTLKSVINIILILNPNHRAVPGARMKINTIPEKNRKITDITRYCLIQYLVSFEEQ